jgi:putative ubiquitin-RnfH superfamily antitoxin RatB of RatAB toxin-antitoxin module
MKVSVAYATAAKQAVLSVELPEGATVQQAIEASGILVRFPEIDLTQQKVGIYTKVVPLDAPAPEGARIEIYRPITADPATVKRRDKTE